jgi:hypothetical protein
MADIAITDSDVSVLVDVARSAGTMLTDDKQARLTQLIEVGLVAPAAPDAGSARYQLTPKGQSVLDDRGVGANES